MDANAAPGGPPLIAPLLPRGVVVLLGLSGGVIVIAGMRASASIIGPLVLALVLTVAVHPLRKLLDEWMPTWLASVICILVVYLTLLGLALAMVVAVARFATLLPAYQEEATRWLNNLLDWLESFGVGESQINAVADSFDLSRVTDLVTSVLGGVAGVAGNLFFILGLVLFMVLDAALFPALFSGVAEQRPLLAQSASEFSHGTRRYLVVATVFGLIVAVLDTIALMVLDIPAPVLWGLLAFITNYVPNIGFVIGVIPPAILALLEDGPGLMIWVIVVYSVINVTIQSVIQPKVVGDAVGLSSTLSFVSLVFWTWVIGPLGAILAIPLTLMAKAILVDPDPNTRWLRPLLSNRPDAGGSSAES